MYMEKLDDLQEYINEIEELIERNKEDFIVWDEYMTEDGIDNSFFWNYETDDIILAFDEERTVLGFVCYDADCSRSDIPSHEDFVYLSLLIVDKNSRGNGIGKSLIKEVLKISSDLGKPVIFGTWQSNDKQIHIAEKFGFKLYETKDNHRHNGEDTLYYKYEPTSAEFSII